MTAWATQRVATSASVRLRRAFFCFSGRRSSAVQNTAVSSRSRSASIVALLGSKVRVDTADFDLLPMPPRPGALPRMAAWNQSSSGNNEKEVGRGALVTRLLFVFLVVDHRRPRSSTMAVSENGVRDRLSESRRNGVDGRLDRSSTELSPLSRRTRRRALGKSPNILGEAGGQGHVWHLTRAVPPSMLGGEEIGGREVEIAVTSTSVANV
jgi:hypothetical protein